MLFNKTGTFFRDLIAMIKVDDEANRPYIPHEPANVWVVFVNNYDDPVGNGSDNSNPEK